MFETQISSSSVLALTGAEFNEAVAEQAPVEKKSRKSRAKPPVEQAPVVAEPKVRKPRKPVVELVSAQTIAALRAHRTRLINARKGVRGKSRAALQERIDGLTAKIDAAQVDPKSLALVSSRALKAHRSRLVAKLPGTRGKVRNALKARIAEYDEKIAA